MAYRNSIIIEKWCVPFIIIITGIIIFSFFIPSVVKIQRVKSYKKIKNYSIGGQRSEPGGKLS